MKSKKQRIALAAMLGGAVFSHSPAANAAYQTARDFLTDVNVKVGSGQVSSAQEGLQLIANVCPGFYGFQFADGSVLESNSLAADLTNIAGGSMTPSLFSSFMSAALARPGTVSFLCGENKVAALDTATGELFPIGSAA